MKKLLNLILCLAVVFAALGGAAAEQAANAPEAPTNFTVWGYSEDYVIMWFTQSDYNYEWKDQYRILLLTGQDEWTDVTDQCISYWTGNEIYYQHAFQEGQSVTLAVAPCEVNADQSITLGEKVISPAFTYKTGSFTPVRNLRAKIENDCLYAAWDRYDVTGFTFKHFGFELCSGLGDVDEIGNPRLIFSSGAGLCKYTSSNLDDYAKNLDKLIVRVDLCVHTGEKYYYPNASLASVELRKGEDGQYSMYRDGQYVDTSDLEFDPKTSLKEAEISPIADQEYKGKAVKPAVTVTWNGDVLSEDWDYTVSYKNNNQPGKATVIVTGIKNFTDTIEATFIIRPAVVKIASLKAAKKALTLKWKKGKGVGGYEIQYGLKKNFKGAKKVNISKASTVQKKLTGLKGGKTYYVRIRAWKKIGGKKVYSGWSQTKKMKTKK